ncbi:FHA domain-containing protein, partial [Planctomycetota bacterium]
WEIYDEQPVSLGRSPENTVVIDNPGISRHHCKVEKRGGVCVVADCGSNNGTFLNGKKVDVANLNNGDEIAVGKHILVFSDEGGVAAPAGPPPIPGMEDAPTDAPPGAEGQNAEFGPNTMMIDMNRQVTSSKEKRGHITIKTKQGEQTIMLRKPEYIIGKGPTCDIVVKGFGISKKHAVIIKDHTGFRLIDVSDKKPTRVNGSPIDRTVLNKGDVIQVGGNEFNFYQED